MLKKNKWIYLLVLASTLLLGAGCSDNVTTDKEETETIKVVTTIAQIGEPLSVIGGELIEVESLMGPSVDPHLYNPTQSDISTIDSADLIFYNGLDLEANMVEVFYKISETKPVLAIGETVPDDLLLEVKDY